MKRIIFSAIVATAMLAGCSSTNKTVCENMICTQEFRMVQVSFRDGAGNPAQVTGFSAVNKRTGKPIIAQDGAGDPNNRATFTVASDADTKSLSEKGDEIVVTATDAGSGKKASATFVVSGGACACHINKISGPEEIVF